MRAVQDRVGRIVSFRGYSFSREDRKDLVQEVMAHLWQAANREGFEAGEKFWGYVEVVTARRCIDALRAKTREAGRERELRLSGSGFVAASETTGSPLHEELRRERAALAEKAMQKLRQPCKELIHLHVGLNRSYREISEELGKSEGALRVQMFRCVREARRILDDLAGKEELN